MVPLVGWLLEAAAEEEDGTAGLRRLLFGEPCRMVSLKRLRRLFDFGELASDRLLSEPDRARSRPENSSHDCDERRTRERRMEEVVEAGGGQMGWKKME